MVLCPTGQELRRQSQTTLNRSLSWRSAAPGTVHHYPARRLGRRASQGDRIHDCQKTVLWSQEDGWGLDRFFGTVGRHAEEARKLPARG
jgi:hypothetical protein